MTSASRAIASAQAAARVAAVSGTCVLDSSCWVSSGRKPILRGVPWKWALQPVSTAERKVSLIKEDHHHWSPQKYHWEQGDQLKDALRAFINPVWSPNPAIKLETFMQEAFFFQATPKKCSGHTKQQPNCWPSGRHKAKLPSCHSMPGPMSVYGMQNGLHTWRITRKYKWWNINSSSNQPPSGPSGCLSMCF